MVDWLPLGSAIALAWILAVPMFPRGSLEARVAWGVPLVAIFMGLVVAFAVAGSNLTAWSHNRAVERVRQGRV